MRQCQRGHELTEETAYISPNGRWRCRECTKLWRTKEYSKINPAWPSELVRRLCDLVTQGFSNREIAFILGKSRNAIIGKRLRLGINTPAAAVRPREKPPVKEVVPEPPEPIEPNGPLCFKRGCKNSHQPGVAWCSEHNPRIPKRTREHMADILTHGSGASSIW